MLLFLVSENSKWQYQSLYEAMQKSDIYDPFVLVTALKTVHDGVDKTKANLLQENFEFFKQRKMNVFYAYNQNNLEYIDLQNFSPDIVFYEPPHDLADIQHPIYVSHFALTCYVPYGLEMCAWKYAYTKSFHRFLYAYFVENEYQTKFYQSFAKDKTKNCVAVGYARLDEYFKSYVPFTHWPDEKKIKIIYAPHHSFEENGLRLATFQWSYSVILELAKKYQDKVCWILKPHPRFDYAVLSNNILSSQQLQNFYEEWKKFGTIYAQGDYFNLFRSSDALITDCCSFLGEYLPTQKPIIRLKRKDSVALNGFGEAIVKNDYECYDANELKDTFKKVIIDKIDDKLSQRLEDISVVFDKNKTVAEKIINFLNNI